MSGLFVLCAQKLVNKGQMKYLAYLLEYKFVVPPILLVQVVCDFFKVLPNDILGMPPIWGVDFLLY